MQEIAFCLISTGLKYGAGVQPRVISTLFPPRRNSGNAASIPPVSPEGRDFGFSEQSLGHFPLTHHMQWNLTTYPKVGSMGDPFTNVYLSRSCRVA